MRANFPSPIPVVLALLALPSGLLADVTWEQSVTIVRGSGSRLLRGISGASIGSAINSRVYIHGERMVRSAGKLDELFDLEHGTVTQIRHDKKTYSVLTFDQYRAALHLPAPGVRKPDAPATGASKFDSRVDETHRTKKVSGVELTQVLVNVTQDLSDTPTPDGQPMEFTMDAWIASDSGGTDEYSEFNKRLIEKLGTSADLSQFPEGMTPALRQGMIRLLEESQQLNGVLIEQSTNVTGPSGAGFESGAPGSKRDLGKQAKTGAAKVGHGVGSVFGRVVGGVISSGPGGNVPTPDKAPIPTGGQSGDAPRTRGESGDLLEMAVSTRNFSNSAIDESRFAVPSDYQKAESELVKSSPK